MQASLLSKIYTLRHIERAEAATKLWTLNRALAVLVERCDRLRVEIQTREHFVVAQQNTLTREGEPPDARALLAHLQILQAFSAHTDELQAQLEALETERAAADARVHAAYRELAKLQGRIEAITTALGRARRDTEAAVQRHKLEQFSEWAAARQAQTAHAEALAKP